MRSAWKAVGERRNWDLKQKPLKLHQGLVSRLWYVLGTPDSPPPFLAGVNIAGDPNIILYR